MCIRDRHPDSAGSQFFIMHENAPHLDGQYAAFGMLTEGVDVLNKIAETDTDWSDRPRNPQVMKTVTVETFGVDYPEPEDVYKRQGLPFFSSESITSFGNSGVSQRLHLLNEQQKRHSAHVSFFKTFESIFSPSFQSDPQIYSVVSCHFKCALYFLTSILGW